MPEERKCGTSTVSSLDASANRDWQRDATLPTKPSPTLTVSKSSTGVSSPLAAWTTSESHSRMYSIATSATFVVASTTFRNRRMKSRVVSALEAKASCVTRSSAVSVRERDSWYRATALMTASVTDRLVEQQERSRLERSGLGLEQAEQRRAQQLILASDLLEELNPLVEPGVGVALRK